MKCQRFLFTNRVMQLYLLRYSFAKTKRSAYQTICFCNVKQIELNLASYKRVSASTRLRKTSKLTLNFDVLVLQLRLFSCRMCDMWHVGTRSAEKRCQFVGNCSVSVSATRETFLWLTETILKQRKLMCSCVYLRIC